MDFNIKIKDSLIPRLKAAYNIETKADLENAMKLTVKAHVERVEDHKAMIAVKQSKREFK